MQRDSPDGGHQRAEDMSFRAADESHWASAAAAAIDLPETCRGFDDDSHHPEAQHRNQCLVQLGRHVVYEQDAIPGVQTGGAEERRALPRPPFQLSVARAPTMSSAAAD